MSRLKFVFLLFLVSVVSACSLLDPFVDRRREAGASSKETLYVGQSKPLEPAICYNSLWTPYKDVKKMADEECEQHVAGTHAEPVRQSLFTCRVLIPNHYYFKCAK